VDISIAEAARLAGTTSRTLRHYDAIGLLAPTRTGVNGMRYYDATALRRLQRILLLRGLGLGLPAIAAALQNGQDDAAALHVHVGLLREERHRLDRQIAAVERTIAALREGTEIMAEQMLDGFDHTQYRQEVEQRWGEEAYARSDRWWNTLGEAGRADFLAESRLLGEAWQAAYSAGEQVGSERVRELAARHVAWIARAWGGVQPTGEQVAGLAEMYVADDRFAANYGGPAQAAFVRDALLDYVS
jgi:DNA-binding transcriptional MerR regulator